MLRPFALSLALIGLIALPALAQVPAKPQGKKLDLTFVPDNAVGAVVAHPRRMLTSPQAELWPTEIFSAVCKKEFGFDPMEIEQVVAVAGLPQGGPPPIGVIVRFRQPIDAAAVAKKFLPNAADEKVEGRQARFAASQYDPSIAFADDRTVLYANRNDLAWLLSAKPGAGPLHKLLQSADDSPTAAAYVVMEPIRPMISGILPVLQQTAPPPFIDVLDLPMTVDTLQLSANLGGESNNILGFELKLGAADAAKAENVAKVLKQSLRDGRSMFMSQALRGIEMDDPEDMEVKQATVRYMQRLSDAALAALEPKQVGNHVVIKTDVKAGVAEVGVLSGLLLPAVQSAREAARRAQSQNNLKQIALALLNYEDTHRKMPTPANYDANGKPLLSWRVQILPYIEEQALYQQFHLDEPWDSEHNKKLIDKMPAVFKHPALQDPSKTVYLAIVGKGAAFEHNKKLGMAGISDGTSNTIMVAEVSPEKAVPWTQPADYEFDAEKAVNPNDFGGLSPRGVFNAVFADGHVETLLRSMNPDVLKAMFTRNGGEIVQLP